jgi:hypothetical protein
MASVEVEDRIYKQRTVKMDNTLMFTAENSGAICAFVLTPVGGHFKVCTDSTLGYRAAEKFLARTLGSVWMDSGDEILDYGITEVVKGEDFDGGVSPHAGKGLISGGGFVDIPFHALKWSPQDWHEPTRKSGEEYAEL